MCVVSMVYDHYRDEWQRRWDHQVPRWPSTNNPLVPPTVPARPITQDEVDEFRRLLERAREYDRRNNEPDCELDAKREALKKIAEAMGVDISFA